MALRSLLLMALAGAVVALAPRPVSAVAVVLGVGFVSWSWLRSAAAQRETLRSRTRWFSSIVERSSDMIVLIDRSGRVSWASPSTAMILGLEPDVFLHHQVIDLVHRDDRVRVAAAIGGVRGGQASIRIDYRVRHASGQWIWLESTASDLLDDPDVAAIITTSRDVTKRHVTAQLLAHRAAHDALTGVANRTELENVLAAGLVRAAASGEAVAVAYLDLDGFKAVNDAYGHGAGDELLRTVACSLEGEVRSQDLIARPGGDEFVVVLWGTDLSSALTICERIRSRLAEPMPVPGADGPVRVGASIGLAVATADDTVASLLHEADLALYEAKRRGRNRVEVSGHGLAELGVEVDELIRQALDDTG